MDERRYEMASEMAPERLEGGAIDWSSRHNRSVSNWAAGIKGKACERPILDLCFGLRSWCEDVERGGDGFGASHVTFELACAIRSALNFDLGRLDGGTIDSWICAQLVRVGVDADTGGFL